MQPELDELAKDLAAKQSAHRDAFAELEEQSRNNGHVAPTAYWERWIVASREMGAASAALRERALDLYEYPQDHPLRR